MPVTDAIKRKPRADGERNRLRLIAVAKAAFADRGNKASLDDIARSAGVGVGTLYRHFASREALIGQIYETEGDQLAQAAQRLAEAGPPMEAIRKWLLLLVEYLSTNRILADVLGLSGGGADRICAASGDKLVAAFGGLIDKARRNADLDCAVEPLDVLMAIGGSASLSHTPDWEKGAARLVEIMVAGLARNRETSVDAVRASEAKSDAVNA